NFASPKAKMPPSDATVKAWRRAPMGAGRRVDLRNDVERQRVHARRGEDRRRLCPRKSGHSRQLRARVLRAIYSTDEGWLAARWRRRRHPLARSEGRELRDQAVFELNP